MLKLKSKSHSLVKIIQQRALKYPNRRAILYLLDEELSNIYITYEELDRKAKTIAVFLQQQQLVGERVLLAYPSGLEFVISFLGCLYAGSVAVPINCPSLSDFDKNKDFFRAIVQDSDVAAIFTKGEYIEKIAVYNDHAQGKKRFLIIDANELSEELSENYKLPKFIKNTIAYLQYTSGSTSTPKAAIITHENILHSVTHLAKTWQYAKNSVTLTWAPHSHVYGLICGILTPLFHGSLAILMPASLFVQRPISWLAAISKYKVTHSGCPNFGYELCVQHIDEKSLPFLNLESWVVACNGGEQVQGPTLKRFEEKFKVCGFNTKSFCSAYGMSEVTGPIAVGAYGKSPIEFDLSVKDLQINKITFTKNGNSRLLIGNGHILSGLRAVIVDPVTLKRVKKGMIGEVWIRGPSVAQGYWNRIPETREIFQANIINQKENYFRTGDLGFISNKELCLVGRLKEIIVLYGKKYQPLDLESLVANAVKDYNVLNNRAAFTVPETDNEKLIFLQEVKQECSAEERELISRTIRKILSENFNIDAKEVLCVKENSLPKTASGKLQRTQCKQLYIENKLALFDPVESHKNSATLLLEKNFQQDFLNVLASVLNIDPNQIKLANAISEYGFDSIKIVTLANRINEFFLSNITPAFFFEFKNIRDLMDGFIAKYSAQLNLQYKVNQVLKSELTPTNFSAMSNNPSDIAVIGMSAIFPDADNIDDFWNNLISGKNVINEIPQDRWRWQDFFNEKNNGIKWGGFVKNIAGFDASFFNISPREAELMDPQQRLFLQIAWNAIEDAGYALDSISKRKTGLFVGVFSNNYAELLHGNQIADAYMTTGITQSMLANRVSYLLNFNGPSETIDTACSSSLVAIHHAVRAMQNGDCELAIAGGVNALLTPNAYLSAYQAGMLSEDGRCHTFDKEANGYVRAEGIAAILLKPLSKAIEDRDSIYGVIKGSAVNHGGHVSSLTVPNPNAQAEVIIDACKRANIQPNTLNYIETHGTGTPIGDPIEINGLKKAFLELDPTFSEKNYCALGALKTQIGHLESAAGIAGVIKVLLAMKHQVLPANQNFKELNPYIELNDSPFYILDKTETWLPRKINNKTLSRRAGVSSFGFGGTNAHVILESYDNNLHGYELDTKAQLLSLSAKSEFSLRQRIQDLHAWLQSNADQPLSVIAYNLNLGRVHFDKRCVIVAKTVAELIDTLDQLITMKSATNAVCNFEGFGKLTNRPIFLELFKQLSSEISSGKLSTEEYKEKLLAIGDLYIDGFNIDWALLHPQANQRLHLPTYPFENKRYWLPEAKVKQNTVLLQTSKNQLEKNLDQNKTLSLQEEIQQSLILNVAELLKLEPKNINLTNSLSDQGFDSIAFSLLHLQLEEYYKIKLNPALFFTHNSIETLSLYFLETFPEEMKVAHGKYNIVPFNLSVKSPKQNAEIKSSVKLNESIAIIGISGIMPKSADLEIFWNNLIANNDLISEIPPERWNWQDYNATPKWGGFISDVDMFDASFFNLSSREANLLDPQHRLFLETSWKTIENAGYDPMLFSGKNIGVFVGVEFSDYQDLILEHAKDLHGYIATGNAHSMLANRVSYFLNLKGPSETIDTACSSALVAIHRAINAIRQGECESALAGGVNLLLSPKTYLVASQLGVLSPDGKCKTFDESANGYVRGEGVGALLLKPLSAAERDNDTIYAIIKGSAVKHGGKAQSITAPNVTAQSELLIKAYSEANVEIDSVTFIETHGTGTALGDPVEIEGLKTAFNTLLTHKNVINPFCALGAVKTQVGHLEPAAGMAGILKTILAIQHRCLPANLHLTELNKHVELSNTPFYLCTRNQTWHRLRNTDNTELPLRAGVSSFGFGGTIAHIILEEYITSQKNSDERPAYLFTFSAKKQESLNDKLKDFQSWLHKNKPISLMDLSYTLNTGRSQFSHRWAFVVDSLDNLLQTIELCLLNKFPANCIHHKSEKTSATFEEVIKNLDINVADKKAYYEGLLNLARLYVHEPNLDFEFLYKFTQPKRLTGLPTYPFHKQRYWYDLELDVVKPISNFQGMSNLDETLTYLKSVFATVLRINPNDISINTTYEIYGVDSLLGLEIINHLEKKYGMLPKTLLFEKTNLRALAEYLQQNKSVINLTENTQNSENKDIAIIGMSGRYPLADNVEEFWKNLKEGRDCITEIPKERWDANDYPVRVGNNEKYFNKGGFLREVDMFDPLFFNISPHDASFMDPQERLFMQTVWEVLEDAGYTRKRLKKLVDNKVGVFAGVTHHFYPIYAAEEWGKENRIPINTQIFSIANRISYFLNVTGPSYAIDTACSSSLAAIHLAVESILRGECKMAIAGGVNLSLHPAKYHMLGTYNFLSEQGQCASFAEGGSGYVPAEGVGAVLLKPLKLALEHQDSILGIIKASSSNHGGKTSGYTVPNPTAQAELVKNALEKGKINARSISYVEAHGTGTSLGDPIEIRGLQSAYELFTKDKQYCSIGSVKSNIGHLEAAAGISQLAKVLLQLKYKKLVPSLHAEKLNPYIDFKETPFVVQRELSDWVSDSVRRAAISSFGAGGTNIHLIIEEFNQQKSFSTSILKPFIFVLSAMNEERLLEYAERIHLFLDSQATYTDEFLQNFCYTLQVGREAMSARLGFIFNSIEELKELLYDYITTSKKPTLMCTDSTLSSWLTGDDVEWESRHEIKPEIISLPTYPFAKRRCWYPLLESKKELEKQPMDTNVFYELGWENILTSKSNVNVVAKGKWLIFSDFELGFVLQTELGKENCIYCFPGDKYTEHNNNCYYINSKQPIDYEILINAIIKKENITGIIYLWPTINSNLEENTESLFYTLQSMAKVDLSQQVLFCLVTRGGQSVTQSDVVDMNQYHLWAMTRIFAVENGQCPILLIDIDKNKSLQQESKIIINAMLHQTSNMNQIAIRNNKQYSLRLQRFETHFELTKQAPQAALITGGLGALGMEVAKWLALQGTRYLLLIGASALPDRTEWKNQFNEKINEKINAIVELEKIGVEVIYQNIDVSNFTMMQKTIQDVEQQWNKKINAVFHLAGVTTESIPLKEMSYEILAKVFEPKVHGAMVLHDLFSSNDLDYFVLFSSISALPYFGIKGLSAYATANAFLDGLAMHRRQLGLVATSINWAAWADKGMGHEYDHSQFLKAVGMGVLEPAFAMEQFAKLIQSEQSNLAVMEIDWNKFLNINIEAKNADFFANFMEPDNKKSKLKTFDEQSLRNIILDSLARTLDVELHEINKDVEFQHYGVDSIVGINFITRLNEQIGNMASPMDLYRYPTLRKLSSYLITIMITSNSSTPESNLSEHQLSHLIEKELLEIDKLL